ncbi:MAG: hypothetical protein WC365_06105 [Candidatus Babeliales bacterium]|jgi:hypothetical protein
MTLRKLLFTIPVLVFLMSYVAAQKPFITLFAHGLGGDATQGVYYSGFVGCPIIGIDGPEWGYYRSGPQQSCLAQDADIQAIQEEVEKNVQNNIILLGVSKGAATMLNTIGWIACKAPHHLNSIKAVIVDSPFTNPESVAEHLVKHYLGSIGTSMRSTFNFLETKMYPNYDPQGITPFKTITQQWQYVDRNMVVVFIHSQKDELISVNDSRLLYRELKKLQFSNVYLIEARAGSHGNVCWGPYKNEIFEKLCLIYMKHGLPLPTFYAKQYQFRLQPECLDGASLKLWLNDLQPSVEEINQRIQNSSGTCSCPIL